MLMLMDLAKKVWLVLSDALSSFRRQHVPVSAASMAFSAMLAVIPALLLLTTVTGMLVGSSREAFDRVQEMLNRLIPTYSETILREVGRIAEHRKALGMLNGAVLLFAVMPLLSDMRRVLGTLFGKRRRRPFLLEKLIDLGSTVLFLIGVTAVAVGGAGLSLARDRLTLLDLPAWIGAGTQYGLLLAVAFLLYYAFSRPARPSQLLAGAVAGVSLWFLMRPLFHLFLVYNPGFGFAFGSFKSLFVVIIWIYYSLLVFLFGAVVAASIGRRETIGLRRLVEGKGGLPSSIMDRHVLQYGKDEAIFREGDDSSVLYVVRKGTVGIRKGDQEVSVIGPGRSFGELSFLLASQRIATAVALEDVELASFTNENIVALMNEFPEFIVKMLRAMARRLREANTLID